MSVSGPLTNYFAGPGFLIDNSIIMITHPDAFTFTDGLTTVDNNTIGTLNGIGVDFQFHLDASGQPDFSGGWAALVSFNESTVSPLEPLNDMNSIEQGLGADGTVNVTEDQTFQRTPDGSGGFVISGSALNAGSPGEWSFTINTPEPATWAMMLIGLFGIGVALRRHRVSRTAGVGSSCPR